MSRGDSDALSTALVQVKTMQMTVDELGRKFSSLFRIERGAGTFGIWFSQAMPHIPPIRVTAKDVMAAIERRLQGSTSSDALQEWATLMILFDAYEFGPAGSRGPEGVVADVLHLIATPEIHGELTDSTLARYLTSLREGLPP